MNLDKRTNTINYKDIPKAKIYFMDYGDKSLKLRSSENHYYRTHKWYREIVEKQKDYENLTGNKFSRDYKALVISRPNNKKGLDILSYVFFSDRYKIKTNENNKPKEIIRRYIYKEDIEKVTKTIINLIKDLCNKDILISVPRSDVYKIYRLTGIDITEKLIEAGIRVEERVQ